MSLRDRTPKIVKTGRDYRIVDILNDLEPEDRAALESWLLDARFTPERIVAELHAEGISCSVHSIASYRYNVLKVGDRKR